MVFAHHLPLRFLIVSRPESHLEEACFHVSSARVFEDIWRQEPQSCHAVYSSTVAVREYHQAIRKEVRRLFHLCLHNCQIHRRGILLACVPTRPGSRQIQFLPFAELDQLYIQILSFCPTSHLPVLKQILGHMIMSPVFANREMSRPPGKDILDLAPWQMELTLRGLRSLVSFSYTQPSLIHASFGDFLLDKDRAKHYHIDSEEWIYTTFRCAFSLEYRSLDPHNCSSQPLEGQLLIFFISVNGPMCRL